eukprot:TRINITY_DN5163_c0_g1_i2.p1 TRINITY_DN5163_c0_g1~~TRINITY_DN5163_c0_g1_i2.p1  ORF type:complete len:111 (+),score=24.28 TRINITY_DN5163_c0_g1_i2:129-461(+)
MLSAHNHFIPNHHAFAYSDKSNRLIIDGMDIPQNTSPQHNNTVHVTCATAQLEAYSPGEDRMYINDKEKLFAVFDGHGGGIIDSAYYFVCLFVCLSRFAYSLAILLRFLT